MTDAGSWGRAAVRKYYLLQDAARHLADREIVGVSFDQDNLHRQRVTWDDGTRVWVNRGAGDWEVNGSLLPQYGFLIDSDGLACQLIRRNGRLAESSRGPSGWYCSARTSAPEPDKKLPITPAIRDFRHVGNARFTWRMVWESQAPAPRDLRIFVHFCPADNLEDIAFQDDHTPAPGTSTWRGEVVIPREVEVPDTAASGRYRVLVGMYDSRGRARLHGRQAGENRIDLGTLTLTRGDGERPTLGFEAAADPGDGADGWRLNPPDTVIDFGFARTNGAFRVTLRPNGLRLVPLPASNPFNVTLRLDRLLDTVPAQLKRVLAVPMATGKPGCHVDYRLTGAALSFRHDGRSFAYDVTW
jgi:hypothetical protein